MDYTTASLKLTGRCRDSRKVGNHTYLKRRLSDSIAVLLHRTDIVTFHANGDIGVSTGGWDTVTTRARMNEFLPAPWHVYSERGSTILSNRRWSDKPQTGIEVLLMNSARILADGTVKGGGDVEEHRREIREADNARKRDRNRLRYWTLKANGFLRDNSGCTKSWCHCHPRTGWRSRFRRMELPRKAGTCEQCGCKVIHKPKPCKLTVADIMAEENHSIRVLKMKFYGLEKFFLDANPNVLDERAGYQLLEIEFEPLAWGIHGVRALKMSCSTTGAVYINAVPLFASDVPSALDWMFDTENYLGQVSQVA